MFIIWGARTIAKDLGEDAPVTCANCHNVVSYHFVLARRWLTIFFLPVFPFSTDRYVICPICKNAITMPAADWEARRQSAAPPAVQSA